MGNKKAGMAFQKHGVYGFPINKSHSRILCVNIQLQPFSQALVIKQDLTAWCKEKGTVEIGDHIRNL